MDPLQTVAKVTHILRMPLARLASVAEDLEESDSRDAILSQVEELVALYELSNYLINPDRKGERRPESRVESSGEFCEEIDRLWKRSLRTHRMVNFADNRALALRKLLETDGVRQEINDIEETTGHEKIDFYPLPLGVVIDNLLDNALKYQSLERMLLWVRARADGERIFLIVGNAADGERDKLERLAKDLSVTREIDWVGVSVIHLVAEGCGFLRPRWDVTETPGAPNRLGLEATVQVGRIVD